MRRLLQRLSLFLVACGASAPPPAERATPPPPVEPTPMALEPEPAGPLVDVDTMEQIAEGHSPLRERVDPHRGVLYLLFATDASGEDPRADDDGMIRLAERWCPGEALDDGIDRLQRDLARRMRDPVTEPLFECVDDRCSHPSQMEYDVKGDYEFAQLPEHERPMLIAVEHVEAGSMTEAFLEEAEIFLRDQRAAHAGEACD